MVTIVCGVEDVQDLEAQFISQNPWGCFFYLFVQFVSLSFVF